MEAQSLRILKPGTEYDVLFAGIPRPHGQRVILRDAGIEETLELVQRVARKYAFQTAKLAPKLRRDSLDATLSAIWHFVYEHIQYRLDDPGEEQVRRPIRTWQDRQRGVDCEDYSVFISSILLNLGIPHKLRIAAYAHGWQHIYIVVPKPGIPLSRELENRRDYYVLDCVKDEYNLEHPPTKTRDYPMPLLSEFSGVGGLGALDRSPSIDALALSGFGALGATDAGDFAFAGLGEIGAAPGQQSLGPPQIIVTWPTTSGHTSGMDQYGQIYIADPAMSGLGWFGSKLFKAVKNGVDKVFTVANKIPFVKKLADTVGVKVLNAGLAVTTAGLVTNQTLKQGVAVAGAILAPNAEQGSPQEAQIDPTPARSEGSVGSPSAPVSVVPAQQAPGTALPAPRSFPPGNVLAPPPPPDKQADEPLYKNPMVIGGALLLVGGGLYLATRNSGGGKGLSGVPGGRKHRKKASTTTPKRVKLTPLR